MKNYIFYISCLIFITSCNNSPDSPSDEASPKKTADNLIIENKIEVVNDETNQDVDVFEQIRNLQEETIEKLLSSEKEDVVIYNFINACNEFNNIDHCSYLLDEYKHESNFCNDGEIKHYSKELREFYIIENIEENYSAKLKTSFIEKTLNSVKMKGDNNKRFVDLYIDEVDHYYEICLEGLELTVSFEDLLNSTLAWGAIYKESKDKAYFNLVEGYYSKFQDYLLHNYCGAAWFDEENGQLKEDYHEQIQQVIKSNPENQLSDDYEEFCSL